MRGAPRAERLQPADVVVARNDDDVKVRCGILLGLRRLCAAATMRPTCEEELFSVTRGLFLDLSLIVLGDSSADNAQSASSTFYRQHAPPGLPLLLRARRGDPRQPPLRVRAVEDRVAKLEKVVAQLEAISSPTATTPRSPSRSCQVRRRQGRASRIPKLVAARLNRRTSRHQFSLAYRLALGVGQEGPRDVRQLGRAGDSGMGCYAMDPGYDKYGPFFSRDRGVQGAAAQARDRLVARRRGDARRRRARPVEARLPALSCASASAPTSLTSRCRAR